MTFIQQDNGPLQKFQVERLSVAIYETRVAMGRAAGLAVIDKIKALQSRPGPVRMIFAAAPSQNEFLETLVQGRGIDWTRIIAFHMDDYLGLADDAPQRFSNYLKEHLFERLPFGKVHYLIGPDSELVRNDSRERSAGAIRKACSDYSHLLKEAPIDIVCMGIGENGHVAFNDPPVADFNDPDWVKLVELEERCRIQQVNDGCFRTLAEVPTHALSLTVPALMAGTSLFCMVPGPTKRQAVYRTLHGPVSTECPATVLRNHPDARLYLDREAAADWTEA